MKAKSKGKSGKVVNKKDILKEPSTPILFNQNSNSCSNDTNLSTLSSSTNQQQLQQQNPVYQKQAKVRSLLKELQSYVKKCQQERVNSEPNLVNIMKTHERLKKEEKISSFYRKKLRSMYSLSLKESDDEIKALRQALDCINQVRLTQNEIRLVQQQQQHNPLSSPSLLLSNSIYSVNHHDETIKRGTTITMRRGVLMNMLNQAALTLPLWVGEIGQAAPPLCGSLPPESNYICKPGDKVAAIVKSNSGNTTTTATAAVASTSSGNGKKAKNINTTIVEEELEEENWILAEVISYNQNTGKYEVEDVDAEEGQERYTLGKKRVVPLPLWRANPYTDPDAIFPKDSFVLALYPQTTCFYRGIIHESPQSPQEDYLILFEDNTYPEGYSPPLNVPQLYVVADRMSKK